MSSDEEVDRVPPVRGSRVVNGLNVREFVEQRGGSFEIDGDKGTPWEEDEVEELRAANMFPRKQAHSKFSATELNQEFYKGFMAQDFTKLKQKNSDETNEDSFEDMARDMENITEDGGVKKKVLLAGWGGQIKAGQVVYVDYMITYEGGDETVRFEQVVDTTKVPDKGREPFRFKVGAGNVIPVFDIGVLTMENHESARFLATYKYAYGKLGLFKEVPAETTVKVEICINRVVDGCENLNVWELDTEERMKLPFTEKMKAVNELKEYGRDHVKKEQYQLARVKYRQGLQILHEIITPNLVESKKVTKLQYLLLINVGHCRIKEMEHRKAVQYLQEAVDLDLPSVDKLKGYFRLALCHSELGNFAEARKNVDIAKAIDGANPDIDQLYMKKILHDLEAEKRYAIQMFKK